MSDAYVLSQVPGNNGILNPKSSTHCVINTVTHNNIYPIQVLNVDNIGFFANKVFDYFNTGSFSCQVQGSHLIQRKKLQK